MQGRASHTEALVRILIVLAWVCAIATPAVAATAVKPLGAYFKETWTTRDGLPHNLVHAVVQTPDGYLWFATWEGLTRYNGREFHLFDRGNVPELRDNGIRALRAARDGGLWLGTSRGGVTRYRDGHWTTFTIKDGLSQDEVMDVLEDRQGRLWITSESGGVTRLDGTRATQFHLAQGLLSEVMYDLAEDQHGTVWAGSTDGLVRFDGDQVRVFSVADGLPSGQVFTITEGADGALLVGTERGVYRREGERFAPLDPALPQDNVFNMLLDRDGTLWLGAVNNGLLRYGEHGVEQLSTVRGLPNDRISTLFQDREGSVWVGTNAGLLRLRDAPFTTFTTEHGLPDDYVRSVTTDAQGTLWVGTSGGLAVLRDGRFEAVTHADGLPTDSLLSLAGTRDGSLWIGSYSAGAVLWRDGVRRRITAADGLVGNQVRSVVEGRDGTVWFGTTRGLVRLDGSGVRAFTTAEGLPRDFIIALLEDRRGRLWVGTANGLAVMENGRLSGRSLVMMDDAQDVFGFYESPDGDLWIATDRGLVRARDDGMRHIGRKQGIPVETIFQVLGDEEGSLWLTSNRGILRASYADLTAVADGSRAQAAFEVYGEADGMASAQNNGGSSPAAWRTGDGRLWFGTAKGLAMTDPERLHRLVRQPPPIVIEEVRVEDQSLPLRDSLVLPAGTRKLELHFAGLSYLMPQKMRYRYRLDGFDRDWVERGTLRFAQFTNLAPGDYVFRVVASNPDGVWSDHEARLAIHVEPLLLQRREFWTVAILATMLGFYAWYRWRVRRLKRLQRKLRELVDSRTSDLRAQAERLTVADQEKSQLLDQLRQQSESFERQAREDPLTGLANRRSFDEDLAREFVSAQRNGRSLALALCDLDHFKQLNDTHSHEAGDTALRAVADLIRESCRGGDLTARWGGEEFALLFPGTDREDAHRICERLRVAVEQFDCSAFAPGARMTISVGVTDGTGLSHHEKLVSRADAKLYMAKHGGRNRVCS